MVGSRHIKHFLCQNRPAEIAQHLWFQLVKCLAGSGVVLAANYVQKLAYCESSTGPTGIGSDRHRGDANAHRRAQYIAVTVLVLGAADRIGIRDTAVFLVPGAHRTHAKSFGVDVLRRSSPGRVSELKVVNVVNVVNVWARSRSDSRLLGGCRRERPKLTEMRWLRRF